MEYSPFLTIERMVTCPSSCLPEAYLQSKLFLVVCCNGVMNGKDETTHTCSTASKIRVLMCGHHTNHLGCDQRFVQVDVDAAEGDPGAAS